MSLFSRLFGRKPAPAKPLPPINEDWRVGDLAECMATRIQWHEVPDIKPVSCGQVFRVSAVVKGRYSRTGEPAWGLKFVGLNHPTAAYPAVCFRKIQHRYEPAEEEFTALIKRKSPVSA